jgi:hypothetical protein
LKFNLEAIQSLLAPGTALRGALIQGKNWSGWYSEHHLIVSLRYQKSDSTDVVPGKTVARTPKEINQ